MCANETSKSLKLAIKRAISNRDRRPSAASINCLYYQLRGPLRYMSFILLYQAYSCPFSVFYPNSKSLGLLCRPTARPCMARSDAWLRAGPAHVARGLQGAPALRPEEARRQVPGEETRLGAGGSGCAGGVWLHARARCVPGLGASDPYQCHPCPGPPWPRLPLPSPLHPAPSAFVATSSCTPPPLCL